MPRKKKGEITLATRRRRKQRLPAIPQVAMPVGETDLATFKPDQLCVRMVEELLLAPYKYPEDLAEACEAPVEEVKRRWLDPTTAFWISRVIADRVRNMLDVPTLSMYQKALGGDPRCYELLLKRYGAIVNKSMVAHAHLNVTDASTKTDYSGLSDEELEQMIQELERELGKAQEPRVVDVTPHAPEGDGT